MTQLEKIRALENIRDILLKNGTSQENLDRICDLIDKELEKLIK